MAQKAKTTKSAKAKKTTPKRETVRKPEKSSASRPDLNW